MRRLKVFLVHNHTVLLDSLQVLLPTRAEYWVIGKAGDCTPAIESVKGLHPPCGTHRSVHGCHERDRGYPPNPCGVAAPNGISAPRWRVNA
jgi:hypothetical protein